MNRADKLRRWTAEALGRHAAVQVELERRHEEPPRPGDLFLFEETAELPVEWAVIGRDPRDSQRLLVVPADTNPMAGSADVVVPDEAAAGPLSLRCRFGVWLRVKQLDPKLRTRAFEQQFVDQAWRKWETLEEGSLAGSPLEREIDAKPRYEDWVGDVVARAQATLAGGARAPREVPVRALDFPAPVKDRTDDDRRSRRDVSTRVRGVAASILLLVALSLLVGLVVQSRRMARLEEAISVPEKPLVNVPVVYLNPRQRLRGPADRFTVPAGAARYQLILQITDLRPSYRLEVVPEATGEPTWSRDGLVRAGPGSLIVQLPRHWLPAGGYRLLLYGPEGEGELVAEYGLTLELEEP